jgi:hypothetical protein
MAVQVEGMGHRLSDCIAQRKSPTSQQRLQCRHRARPMGGDNKEPCVQWCCGCWGAELYNAERPHTALDKRTQDIAYFTQAEMQKAA